MSMATRLQGPSGLAIALLASGLVSAAPVWAQGTEGNTPEPTNTAPLPPPDSLRLPGSTVPPAPAAPSPATSPLVNNDLGAVDFGTYRLGPGDSFFVSVPRFPELSFQATLDIQGNVIVPLEGAVNFNGLTLAQTEQLINRIYDQYVVNPRVTLTLVAQRGVEVTVVGEVVEPGFYPLGEPEIATAIFAAGGTTEWADLRDIRIRRRILSTNERGETDIQFVESTVDFFTPLQEGLPIPDIAMQDGDVVIVERLNPGELDEYNSALVARTNVARPVISVRVLNYGAGGGLSTINLDNGSRFIDAIATGRVSSETTNLGQIALVRFDEEAGQAITTVLDGGAAFRGDPTQNPQLQHNDVIIMNRSFLARLTYGINVFTQPFRDILGFLLFFDSLSESAEDLFRP
jgi:polysaccharide export outer membrane protein